jgi:signal transduction histidine kinase
VRAEIRKRREENPAGHRPGNLRLAEEESARSNRENERFIAVVSHELRQPLNAAIAAMALSEADSTPETSARARGVLHRQLVHMSALLDDLLDMSRLTLGTLKIQSKPLDVREIMQDALDTIESAAERAGVNVRAHFPATPVLVSGDPGRLLQAGSNLLTNAVRYTPRGGSVHVSMTVDGAIASIAIADTGQGISPSDLTNVFEPFWRGGQSSSEGFGIGLALVRGIVELHGGSIAASSEGRGMGARFCLTLPLFE